jgi:hypothetical protein
MVTQNGDDGSERTSESDGGSLRAECLHDKYAYITHIRLSGPQSPRPSAVELVSMLEQSLQLEVFSLSNMDVAVPGVQMGGPAIRLPDIKTFELEGISPMAIAFILKRVYIPCMAPLFIPSRHDTGCAQSLDCKEIEQALSLQIDARRLALCVGTAPDVNLALSDNSEPLGSSSSVIGKLYSAIDLSLVTHLQYHGAHTGNRAPAIGHWNALLVSMRSLTTLGLDAPNQLDITRSIIVALTPDEDQATDLRLCPRLQHLRLDLSSRRDAADTATVIYCLLRCLRIRRSSGYASLGISLVLPHTGGSGNISVVEQLKVLADFVHVSVSTVMQPLSIC